MSEYDPLKNDECKWRPIRTHGEGKRLPDLSTREPVPKPFFNLRKIAVPLALLSLNGGDLWVTLCYLRRDGLGAERGLLWRLILSLGGVERFIGIKIATAVLFSTIFGLWPDSEKKQRIGDALLWAFGALVWVECLAYWWTN